MARSLNRAELIGNIGKDAETKFTPSGVARSQFSVATSRTWKDKTTGEQKEHTEWHNVTAWRSENLAPFLRKGQQVYIAGELQTRSWDDDQTGLRKYFTEIVAREVILLGKKDDTRPPANAQPASEAQEPDPSMGITDDDVPF